MEDYRVQLDIYHGPLDLLLYLIRRDEIEIYDIPIAHIAEQYIDYLQHLRQLDINVAGEFLVMAATLMEIKSAMLAPRPREEAAEDEDLSPAEDPTDPRYELIQQLLAYKRFKDAASELDERRESFAARFARRPVVPSEEEDDAPPALELDDVSIWDLVEAFGRMMDEIGRGSRFYEITQDDTPVELHAADIVDRLERDGAMSLQQMFEGRQTVAEMVGLFLATLELVRQRRLHVTQARPGGEIQLQLRETGEEAPADEEEHEGQRSPPDANDPDAFHWPDETLKQRFIRRQERRARGEKVEEDEELEAEIRQLEQEEDAALLDSDEAGLEEGPADPAEPEEPAASEPEEHSADEPPDAADAPPHD